VLKGPECTLGAFDEFYCPFSFEISKLASLELFKVYLEGYISFWIDFRTAGFY
jgi:hypothetical protein